MKKNGFLGLILAGVLTACSGGGGGGGSGGGNGGGGINNEPTSPIPTAPVSDPSQAGGAGSGACGLNGTYGICENVSFGGGETLSVKVYSVVSGCNTLESKFTFFTATNCSGDKYYERTRKYALSEIADSGSVAGAKEIKLSLTNISQTLFTGASGGVNQQDYLFCDSDDLNSFDVDVAQSKTGSQCFASNTPSIHNFTLIKITAQGLYEGDSGACSGYNQECISTGERPTTLRGTGFPVWQ